MSFRAAFMAVVVFCAVSPACADEVLYRYEGDVLPYDPSAGWVIADACETVCTESLHTENGYFVLHWSEANDWVNYHYWIAVPPDDPPPTLWAEWSFRSNHPVGPVFTMCDASFAVAYGALFEVIDMYGDAAFSWSGDYSVTGLDIDDFHTYRFESLDGINYRVSVDGLVFIALADDSFHLPIGLRAVSPINRMTQNATVQMSIIHLL